MGFLSIFLDSAVCQRNGVQNGGKRKGRMLGKDQDRRMEENLSLIHI